MCFIAQGTGEPCSASVRQTPVSSPMLKLPFGRQHAAVLAEVRNYPMIYFIPKEQQQQLSKKQWQVRSSRPVEPTRSSILTPPITQIKHPHGHPVLIPRPLGQSNCIPQRPGGSRVWRDQCPHSSDRSGGRHSPWPPRQWVPLGPSTPSPEQSRSRSSLLFHYSPAPGHTLLFCALHNSCFFPRDNEAVHCFQISIISMYLKSEVPFWLHKSQINY